VLNLETPMSGDRNPPDRARLEADWLTLTRQTLPTLAKARRWPVSADHCFMRILLDAVHKDVGTPSCNVALLISIWIWTDYWRLWRSPRQ
jgi:hypothetical protein